MVQETGLTKVSVNERSEWHITIGCTATMRLAKPGAQPPNFPVECSINTGIIPPMAKIQDILSQMRENPKGIKFNDLTKVCDAYFGEPRQSGSSHKVYRTPWKGDPRVNIQNANGKSKAYQVKQVLQAVERMEAQNGKKY